MVPFRLPIEETLTIEKLVYGGEGGLRSYFTHPPELDRPFALINLPHAAFSNVWQWLALPHEVGHDLYATVRGLDVELEAAVGEAMRQAVKGKEIEVPGVHLDLSPHGVQHVIDLHLRRHFLLRRLHCHSALPHCARFQQEKRSL